MVASDSFAEFLREQLAPLGHLTLRRMFGKTGVFCNGLMFGMVTNDTLYVRMDKQNRATFVESAAEPLLNYQKGGARSTSPSAACPTDCWMNPMNLSPGRARQWERHAGSRHNARRRHQSADQPGMPESIQRPGYQPALSANRA